MAASQLFCCSKPTACYKINLESAWAGTKTDHHPLFCYFNFDFKFEFPAPVSYHILFYLLVRVHRLLCVGGPTVNRVEVRISFQELNNWCKDSNQTQAPPRIDAYMRLTYVRLSVGGD